MKLNNLISDINILINSADQDYLNRHVEPYIEYLNQFNYFLNEAKKYGINDIDEIQTVPFQKRGLNGMVGSDAEKAKLREIIINAKRLYERLIKLQGSQNLSKRISNMENHEDDNEFVVFISHGRSAAWKDVARFIEKELDLPTVVLKEEVNRGRTIIEKLDEETENCSFAIIIMTAEDEQQDGKLRARQNVVHEIGFCQGKFGRENVLVLRQENVEEFTNISGIVYEPFKLDNIETTFPRIIKEIRAAIDEKSEDDYEED